MGLLLKEMNLAVRMFWRSPAFTLSAVVALALGIGANAAIFSVVNAVLLRPLPYSEPERLVTVFEKGRRFRQASLSPADYVEWRRQTSVFDEMACYTGGSFNLAGGERPARVDGIAVSASIFRTLGVEPEIGRALLDEENQPGSSRTVVISHELWQRVFNSDPRILERSLTLDGEDYSIVGVMPKDFRFLLKSDLITPFQMDPNYRANAFLRVIGRLKEGATAAQAKAEMQVVGGRLELAHPRADTAARLGTEIVPLRELTAENNRLVLVILFGAVGLVLLIACANVANLLLARAMGRQKEMAIRAALGASRWDLIRQLLTESVLLGLASGVAGLLLASWTIDLLVGLAPDTLPRVNTIGIDTRVFGFTLIVSLATSFLFGLAPAMQTSKLDITDALKEGARSSRSGFIGLGFRNLLVVSQVGLALILSIGAALLVNSLVRVLNVHKGFDADNLLTMSVSLPETYGTKQQITAFYENVLKRINEVPGVVSASSVNQLPLGRMGLMGDYQIEGRAPAEDMARKVITSGRYFASLRIPLVGGREFNDADSPTSSHVAIVNESFARANFGEEDPLGHRLSLDKDGQGHPIWCEIVGVAKDVKQDGLAAGFEPAIFIPFTQTNRIFWLNFATLVIRTTMEPTNLSAAIQKEIHAVDPDLPAYDVRTMRQVVSDSVSDTRFETLLLGGFAGLALALAAVGIYGVISYSVTQRTRELGIRLALGAAPGDVLKLVVRQGIALASVGTLIGLVGAFAVTRLISSLLFEVTPTDPMTFLSVAVLVMSIALVASLLPARRAAKVDPMVALRWE